MTKKIALAATVVALWSTILLPADEPEMPYFDWGACPFECCTYRQWTTNAEVILRACRGMASPVAVVVPKGQDVLGITGVVVTYKPGKVKILQPFELDEQKPVSASPGDILYTLHYQGEGYWTFWFKGQLHSDQLVADQIEAEPRPGAAWQVLTMPETEWWVKIRNKQGAVGWTKEVEEFDHIDACE